MDYLSAWSIYQLFVIDFDLDSDSGFDLDSDFVARPRFAFANCN